MKRKRKPRRDYWVQVGPFWRLVTGATSVGNAARRAFRELIRCNEHLSARERPLDNQPSSTPEGGFKGVDVVLV